MKHEVSYVFVDNYDTVRKVVKRMNVLGFEYAYKELRMADGTVHKFCVCNDEWIEMPDMEAALKWLCSDIYRLKEAYDDCIISKEMADV